jgi:PIN domain nuclease of toxin-antitoxin system
MLLDTCAVLWLSFDENKLSPTVLRRIDNEERVLICSLSFWEIGIKIRKKKLEIPIPLNELVSRYVENNTVEIVAPDVGIILRAVELDWDHRDPVDRIIVASAIKHNAEIITTDAVISRFYKKTAF